MTLELREYAGQSDISGAEIVIAATGAPVDQSIADDARSLHRLIVVVGDPDVGSFTSMAVHRAGPLTVGISAGGVPAAAIQIRDAIAERFDSRYAEALAVCSEARSNSLDNAGTAEWAKLNGDLIRKDFCERVESGTFAKEVEECR